MKIPDSIDELPTNGTRGRVYGEPYRTADGGTVITVAKVRAGTATPVGVFVVHGALRPGCRLSIRTGSR